VRERQSGTSPTTVEAVEAARVARESGHLKVAQRALDHAARGLGPGDGPLRPRLAEEGDLLGRALLAEGATLAALGEWLRARALGRAEARASVASVAAEYVRWRPRPGPIGAPKDALQAAATGAFWVGPRARARVLVVEGGITGEGTEAFGRVLDLCSRGAEWVLVDMARLTYVGSAGLAVAVKLAERLRAAKGGLCMFSMSPNLKLLVETLGLAHFLNPTIAVADALDLAAGSGG
jgi:anti-anti-sigma factor